MDSKEDIVTMLYPSSTRSHLAAWAAALLTLVVCAGTSAAQQSGRVIDLNLDFTPSTVAAGDLLGSPAPDIITTTGNLPSSDGQLAIIVNQGPCNSPTMEMVAVVTSPTQIVLADLNADDQLDIVARAGPFVSVLINQRPVSETFVRTDYTVGAVFLSGEVFAGDIDGDGDVDLGMRNNVLPNLGSGTFGSSYELTQPGTNDVAGWQWGDFDGDGDMDVAGVTSVITEPGMFQPVLRSWNSNGTSLSFTPWTDLALGPPSPAVNNFDALVSGDFNLDGSLDLIAGIRAQGSDLSSRTIALGDAIQGFISGGPGPSSETAETLRPGQGFDTDGDGHAEIIPAYRAPEVFPGQPIIPNDLTGLESIPLNVTPTGLMPSATPYPAIDGHYGAADFNADGVLDFAVARPASAPNTLRVIYGGTGPLYELTLISGQLTESLFAGDSLSAPIVAELRNCFGNAAADQLIQISGLPPGASVIGPDPLLTDANGQVSFSIQFDFSAPNAEISAFHELSNSIDLDIDVVPGVTIAITEDSPGFATSQRRDSIEVTATDSMTGGPAGGVSIGVSSSANIEVLSSGSELVTDADGRVTIDFRPIGLGIANLQATVEGDLNTMVSTEFFIRNLRVVLTPTLAVILYSHENEGIPLILAVDVPLPAPGYVSTIFGRVHTSVLNPQPTLTVLTNDDIPTLQTPLSLVVQIPPGLDGIDLVLQCYGIDTNYSFPNNVFISNPFFLTP